MMRAGLPTTTAWAGTLRVTTAPAPTMAPRPMVSPGRIVALAPIDAPSSITVAVNLSGRACCGEAVVGERRVRSDEHVVPQA